MNKKICGNRCCWTLADPAGMFDNTFEEMFLGNKWF